MGDKAKKDIMKIFSEFGLKITAQTNQKITNFLDITLNLTNGKFHPYRKPNDEPLYVHSHSNHPPSILRQIPSSINNRISQLSSDQESFQSAIPAYEEALRRSEFQSNLEYLPNTPSNVNERPSQRNRRRKIIWFNPPFSKNVQTNVGRLFLSLVDKHFPTTNKLHKIFNRNTMKVSYSCMGNVKSAISQHNARILSKKMKVNTEKERKCDCRNKNDCPLSGNCQATNVVYKAEVSVADNSEKKIYIGMTANGFKQRYRNHQKSFRNEIYKNETELSKYIWCLKRNQRKFTLNWSILSHAAAYQSGAKKCNLCLEEKLQLIKADRVFLLNKRSEIISKCRHKNKFCTNNLIRGKKKRNLSNPQP